jgi:CRP/FNR family transcriptional activator FtrB
VRHTDLSIVRNLPLFQGMTDEHFEELMETALLQRFPAHVTLIEEGTLPDFLHVVIEGDVELFATHDGRETTIDIIRPVTTFVLAAVIRDEVYLKSARTLTETLILMLPADRLRGVFMKDIAFARAVVDELALRYRAVVRALKYEKLRTSAERLANWILKTDKQQGSSGSVSFTFDKRVLASQLGMSPENLSRTLQLLTKHGIKSRGRSILIEDRPALSAFAQPTALIDS